VVKKNTHHVKTNILHFAAIILRYTQNLKNFLKTKIHFERCSSTFYFEFESNGEVLIPKIDSISELSELITQTI